MKYFSEITNDMYETSEECEQAEKQYEEEQKKREEEILQKSTARKAAAKEVEEAYEALVAARKAYSEKLHDFCSRYGSFHMSLSPENIGDWLRNLFVDWF